jgi:undecaprenyl-diphosphatase
MLDLLYSIDIAVFFFINHTLANPVFDIVMPFITDLNKNKPVLYLLGIWIVYLLVKGGKTERVTVGLLVVTVVISDQLNSAFLKELFGRVRPCRALEGVRMLVDCGGGLSFPSSHDVNNYAAAAIIGHNFPRQRWYWLCFAALVALSRPYVGVHYPSDILAGGLIGFGIGICIVTLWNLTEQKLLKTH